MENKCRRDHWVGDPLRKNARIKLREAIKDNPELAQHHKSRTQRRWVKGSEELKAIQGVLLQKH